MLNNENFTLQWNITKECEYKCGYCYLNQQTNFEMINSNIILSEIIKFRTLFSNFRINITGGNPLLHVDFEKIVECLYKENIKVRILGNPIHSDFIDKLKSVAKFIDYYQLSLDGTKGQLLNRGSDNVATVWESVDILNSINIKPTIMFTLTSNNKNEIIPIIEDCIKKNVHSFTFSRLVVNQKNTLKYKNNDLVRDYKTTLQYMFDFLVENNVGIFNFKDNLWKLLLYENGLYTPNSDCITGCSMGISSICIMPNGDIYPCSRLPLNLGNIQVSKLIDIWENHQVLSELRNFQNYQKCKKCILVNNCRGCPAIAYAESGSYLEKDPYCWN